MFEIKGILDLKLDNRGFILRSKSFFTKTLHTEDGVIRFLKEQRPFLNLRVTNNNTSEDVTSYFLDMEI